MASSAVVEDKEIVLKCGRRETVRHALVLIEGEIKPSSNEVSSQNDLKLRLTQEKPALEVQNLSNSKVKEVFVDHKGQCHAWPVTDNRFKAFVKLDKGVNLIKIQCRELNLEKELRICYERQQNHDRYVRVVYIKCSDGDGSFDAPADVDNSLAKALQKLAFNALLLQTFMAKEMNRHGFGYQTFGLEQDECGETLVHVFTSELSTERAHEMNGDELYGWFYKELTSSSLNDPNCKFLAFMSCSHYDPPENINLKDIPHYVKAHTALGGGQLGLFGTAGLHTWAREVGELVNCFNDDREIDKKKLFDDSAGRGTYWANYSTTLGAALHELGHCFDLMHMPEGIMARGFDDMHRFVLVTSSLRQCLPSAESADVGNGVERAMGMFADHRAHWFRSSAVLLHYHKWLQSPNDASLIATEKGQQCIYVNWSRDVKGPIGNGGGGQKNQSYFDDISWHKSRELTSSGYVVYHKEYVNAIVTMAGSIAVETEEGFNCPVYGKIDDECLVHSFSLEEGEYLTSVEIRAGAWVDGIRFCSNLKSSIWFGGRGGNWYRMAPSDGECIEGIFGTYGDYLGSLGVRLRKSNYSENFAPLSTPSIESDIGIGLVELRKNDELINFWEFARCSPTEFSLPESWWKPGTSSEKMEIMAVDTDGNICRSGFVGYDEFMKGTNCLEEKTPEKVLQVKDSA